MSLLKQLDESHTRNVLRPSDINEHLDTLCALARDCDSVTEFGIRHGISTLSIFRGLLRGRGHTTGAAEYRGYDIALPHGVLDSLIEYACPSLKISIFEQDSKHGHIDETDMLFIDSLHTRDQCFAELSQNAQYVRKWIVLHDTTTFGERGEDGGLGLTDAIECFMFGNTEWVIRSVVRYNNGMTILERVK